MQQETERLLLREWRLTDFEPYAAYYANPELSRFVGGPCNRETAWRKIAMHSGHWTLRGFGYWAVEEKATGEFCGAVGLWRSDGWPELELGYFLMQEKFGRGYATEAGRCAIDYAWGVVETPSLVSYINPQNTASVRVAERLGARYDGTLELAHFGPHQVYRYAR